MDSSSEIEMLVGRVMKDHDPASFSDSGGKVVVSCCCRGLSPVLQKGPMCGLVALTMAAHLLHKKKQPLQSGDMFHTEQILQFSVGKGLSKQGEMFSTDAMEDVIVHFLHLQSRTLNTDSHGTVQEILTSTAVGEETAILIPYDADKDHTPCLARGHNAHWCLLVGLCIALEPPTEGGVSMIPNFLSCCHSQKASPAHHIVSETHKFAGLLKKLDAEDIKGLLDKNQIYVFVRQGKSRHLGLWSLRNLLESNRNLVEVDPKRSNPQEYVIPAGGLREGLKNKVIFVTKGCAA